MNTRILQIITIATISLAALLSSGCSNNSRPDMYYWGQYETMISRHYTIPGNEEAINEINSIQSDIQYAIRHGDKTPPGVHAYLGYLYAITGKSELAKEAFKTEEKLFPESSVFIDGMMARAFKGKV